MAYSFDLFDAIETHVDRLQDRIFTSLPATVTSYKASEQSVDVSIDVRLSNVLTGEESPAVSLTGVPVVFPSGGGGILSFPIKSGDRVLLCFTKYSIDKWKGGTDGIAGENRQHSISDAIAICGLHNTSSILSPNESDVELKAFGSTVTLLSSGDIQLKPAGKTIIDSDLEVTGDVEISGNTAVSGTLEGAGVKDTNTNNTLSTHTHPTSGAPPTPST